MTLSTLSVVQQILMETKHRDIIPRSTSNNSSQAQERNLPEVLVRPPESKNEPSRKRVELGMQNSQFHQWFWNIREDLASY